MALQPWLRILSVAAWLLPATVSAQAIHMDDSEALVSSAEAGAQTATPDLSAATTSIVKQTNEFRRAEGLAVVESNAKLTAAARYFAEYMSGKDKFGHTADGTQPADRATKHGYDLCIVSENIANQYNSAGFTTEKLADGFVEGWKNSPGHRKNMVDPDVTETGVAVARSAKTGYYYAVQMFGRPKSKTIEFKITNESDVKSEYKIGDETYPLPPRFSRTHQRCRPSEVTLRSSETEEGKVLSVKPNSGDAFVITQENGAFRISKD